MDVGRAAVDVVRCLLCEVNGLEPEGKYLLVRLLLSYQADGGFVSTAKELSESFGVSLPGVWKALKVLEGQGLFSVVAAPDGRGRPKRRFTFTKRLAALLAKVKLPENYKPAFSVELFLTLDWQTSLDGPIWRPDWVDGVVVDKGKSGGFSIANRLLIAVMLTKADRFGVVSSLGLADLKKATGLSKERLTYRLARLVATGVIRSCAPGATGRYLLGLAKSIYILNLADPELSVLGHQPVVFVRRFKPGAFTGWSSLLGRIYDGAMQPRLKEGVGDSELESLGRLTRVQDFFEADERRRLSPALEFRLLSYASALLSNHWELLPASPTQIPIWVPELQKAMSEVFSPPGKVEVGANGFPAETDLVRLHDCLWEAVSRKASEAKCLLLGLKYSQVDQMEYVVLPDALKSVCLTFLALPKPESGTVPRGCYVWELESGGYKRYLSESEISVSDRLDYGLMSQPKRRVGGGDRD